MKAEATSTCQACGARVPAGLDFCPVCAFRGALEEGQETVELKIKPTSSLSFEHYQILTREDGTPLELGRGAMGVTYKAFDIDLRLPVTLKVISENMPVMNRPGCVSCEKPARPQRCATRTWPPCCI